MRDEMVAWLTQTHASIAGQAITKAMRLAQITSGFLGGIEEVYEETQEEVPAFMQDEDWFLKEPPALTTFTLERPIFHSVQEIGREKLDALLMFFQEHQERDPAFKLLVWCRFRPELYRLNDIFSVKFPHVRVASIVG